MATEVPKTILLKTKGATRYDEGVAQESLLPGHLLQQHTDGKLKKHASAGSYAECMVARENAEYGGTIDDAYAANAPMSFYRLVSGDVAYMFCPDGADIDIEDFLTSNGDGTLKVATSTDQRLFAVEEAYDNSAGGAAHRIKVRKL